MISPMDLEILVQGSHDISHGSGDPHFVLLAVVWLEEIRFLWSAHKDPQALQGRAQLQLFHRFVQVFLGFQWDQELIAHAD